MSAATEAQAKTMIANTARVYDQARLWASVNTGTNGSSNAIYNLIANITTFVGAVFGDNIPDCESALYGIRASVNALVNGIGTPLKPLLLTYAQALGNITETTPSGIFARLYRDAIVNSKRVTSRGLVFTAPSVVSAVGNGAFYWLNLDENGIVIDNQHVETKLANCTADSTSTASGRNAERFELLGATPPIDQIVTGNSGATGSITGITCVDSNKIIQNASFDSISGTPAVPTGITGWTSSVTVNATNFQQNVDANTPPAQGSTIYRDYPGAAINASLTVQVPAGGNWTLSQSLQTANQSLLTTSPYWLSIAYKKSSVGTDGTLTLSLGASSASVSLAGVVDTNWHLLVLGPGKQNWYQNLNQANLTLSLARSGGSTGNITLDDLLFTPMTKFDGSWLAAVGGTTQWKLKDQLTWSSVSNNESTAILQNQFWRGLGVYYPACPATPGTVVAAALAGAGAGNIDNGAHTYSYTSVDTNGVESGESPTAAVTVVDKTTNGKVTVTVPAISGSIASHNVYRSAAGTTTPRHLVGNTVTTTLTDNSSDASISAAATPPAGVTWADPT